MAQIPMSSVWHERIHVMCSNHGASMKGVEDSLCGKQYTKYVRSRALSSLLWDILLTWYQSMIRIRAAS